MKTKFTFLGIFMLFPCLIFAENALIKEDLPHLITARSAHVQLVNSANEYVVLGGHISGFNLTKSVETYDNTAKQWTLTTSVDNRDMPFVAKLQNGKYLIGAGCSSSWGVGQLATTELYNPADKSFTAAGSMSVARTNATSATLKDGRVLVLGNWYASASKGEIYDPITNTFTSTGDCLNQRAYPVIIPTNDGGAIVGGGVGTRGAQLGGLVFEKYNPTSNSFSAISTATFYGETGWTTSAVGPTLTQQYLLPSGKYALIIYKPDNSKVGIITIDPVTEVIAEVTLQRSIPVTDTDNPSIVFGSNTIPMIDQTKNLLHIVQAGKDATHMLRVVTINISTGAVNWAKMTGFDYYPSSGNISMLADGRILFSGGMKPDNFTLSDKAYIITVPIYPNTALDETDKKDAIQVSWNAMQDAFVLNTVVGKATLYDVNGKVLAEKYNTNQITYTQFSTGIYLIKVQYLYSNKTQVIKAIIN